MHPKLDAYLNVPPHEESITTFCCQINLGTYGQKYFGRHMSKRQTSQHGNLELKSQSVYDRFKFETLVVCDQFKVGELTKDNGFLTL